MKATVFVFSNYTFMQIIITEATKKTGTIEIQPLQCFDFVQQLMEHDSSNVPFDLAMKASLTRIKD